MKVKKLILLYFALAAEMIATGIVQHTLISITEQRIMGKIFKHVMTSGSAEKDEFFINGSLVTKNNYEDEFELAQKKEREEELCKHETQRRARLQFIEMAQVEITAKLLYKVIAQISYLIDRIENSALEKFFVFNDSTIDSLDQLLQLKMLNLQLADSVKKKIAVNDFEGLHLLYNKLEHWPDRFEKFFQDTVQNAIKKSDDTVMLKQLLTLIS